MCFVREGELWEAVFENGRRIRSTGDHPVYAVDRGWIAVEELRRGDALLSTNQERIPVVEVRNTGSTETVYNLEVEEDHTYFVGDAEWNVWVHNANEMQPGYKIDPAHTEKKLAEAAPAGAPGGVAPSTPVQRRTLYHYTDEAGLGGITESN